MDKTRAIALLGLDETSLEDEELIQDALDEEVFKITSFFLNRMLIPKLARAKIMRLQKLNEAFFLLMREKPNEVEEALADNLALNQNSLVELIQGMQSVEMSIKLALSQAQNPESAIGNLQQWVNLINLYATIFLEIFPKSNINPEIAPSMTRYVEYGQMISELKSGNYDGWAAQEYARLAKLMT